MHPENQVDTVNLLHSAREHLHAAIGMVEAGQSWEQVLSLLCLAQSALQNAGNQLIDCQINSCTETILKNPCAEIRVAEFNRLSDLYTFLIRFTDFTL